MPYHFQIGIDKEFGSSELMAEEMVLAFRHQQQQHNNHFSDRMHLHDFKDQQSPCSSSSQESDQIEPESKRMRLDEQEIGKIDHANGYCSVSTSGSGSPVGNGDLTLEEESGALSKAEPESIADAQKPDQHITKLSMQSNEFSTLDASPFGLESCPTVKRRRKPDGKFLFLKMLSGCNYLR